MLDARAVEELPHVLRIIVGTCPRQLLALLPRQGSIGAAVGVRGNADVDCDGCVDFDRVESRVGSLTKYHSALNPRDFKHWTFAIPRSTYTALRPPTFLLHLSLRKQKKTLRKLATVQLSGTQGFVTSRQWRVLKVANLTS